MHLYWPRLESQTKAASSKTKLLGSLGVRTQAPPSSDYADKPDIPDFEDCLGTTKDLGPDESVLVLQGRLDVQDMQVPAYRTGISGRDVFHLALTEVRIGVFHMSSFGWRSGYQEGCENWVKFLTAAIAAQADFITGDGNLFAQRNFKQDAHTDFKFFSPIPRDRNIFRTSTLVSRILIKQHTRHLWWCLSFIAKKVSERVPINRTRKDKRFGRPERPRGRAQDDDEEEEEVEVEEEHEPVGRLRSTTPSSGARLRGQDADARGSQLAST
eukprot:s2501_g14.t1